MLMMTTLVTGGRGTPVAGAVGSNEAVGRAVVTAAEALGETIRVAVATPPVGVAPQAPKRMPSMVIST
jgi:hypothetical protein